MLGHVIFKHSLIAIFYVTCYRLVVLSVPISSPLLIYIQSICLVEFLPTASPSSSLSGCRKKWLPHVLTWHLLSAIIALDNRIIRYSVMYSKHWAQIHNGKGELLTDWEWQGGSKQQSSLLLRCFSFITCIFYIWRR